MVNVLLLKHAKIRHHEFSTEEVDNIYHLYTGLLTLPQISIWKHHFQASITDMWRAKLAGCVSTYASENPFIHGKAGFHWDSQRGHI